MNKLKLSLLAATLGLGALTAKADEATVSGSVSFDFNSHFMSYGLDVWGAGSSPDSLFQPSASLDFNFGDYGFYTGVWFDINNQVESTLGGDIQEVDVWVGTYFTAGDFTYDLTFQQWYYASETEGIIDFTISYDAALAPYAKLHYRIDSVGGQEKGAILELGAGYTINDYLSVPFAVGLALEQEFQGGDNFLGYVTTGLGFSVPLEFVAEGLGAWDFHGGINAFYVPEDFAPSNPDEFFLTFSVGVGIGF